MKKIINVSNRCIWILITIVFSFAVILCFSEVDTYADENDSITWELDETTGTLIYYGEGIFNHVDFKDDEAGKVKKIIVSEGFTSISSHAFSYTKATSVILPDSLVGINSNSFWDTKLESIRIPKNVSYLGSDLFNGSKNMGYIEVDPQNQYFCSIDGVLYDKAVTNLIYVPQKMQQVKIPDSVTRIENFAFNGCVNIKKINIPRCLESIGAYVFTGCPISEIEVSQENSHYKMDGNMLIENNDTLAYVIANIEDLVIPSYITYINCNFNSDILRTLYIPGSVSYVPGWLCTACPNLEEVVIDEGAKSIGYDCFYRCVNLKKVSIPSTLEKIDNMAFYYCPRLDSLVIEPSVNDIGENAFLCCYNLTIYGEPGSSIEQYFETNFAGKEYVQYKNHYSDDEKVIEEPSLDSLGKTEGICIICGESYVRDIVETGINGNLSWRLNKRTGELIISGVGEYVICETDWDLYRGISIFSNVCPRNKIFVKDVIIEEGITKIGQYEFVGFENLESIIIPASVTDIEGNIFESNTKLKNIVISSDNDKYCVDENNNIVRKTGVRVIDDNEYWFENGIKQGVKLNEDGSVDTSYRGKEVYDPEADAWYWLDNVENGRIAKSKDVYQESDAGNWGDILNEDGTRSGKWVRYDENGHMIKGWSTNENGTYYFDLIYGTMAKGYATIDGIEYYFNPYTGVLERTVAFNLVGYTGWKIVDGTLFWYENGNRQGTSVNAAYRGKEIYDPASDAWYWLDNIDDGKMAVSKEVYQESKADDAGNIGKWVRYDADGHMIKGWYTNEKGTYYFDLVYGTMYKGVHNIDGKEYLFDDVTGIMK